MKHLRRILSVFLASAVIVGGGRLGAMPAVSAQEAGEGTQSIWFGRPAEIIPTTEGDHVTTIGVGGEEWYVAGYNGSGIHSEAGNENNVTLLHKLDEYSGKDEDLRYGWYPFRDYAFLEGDGNGNFEQFQEHWGKRWVLYLGSSGTVINPMMPDDAQNGTYKKELNRALYYEVDADAQDGEQGFTEPTDYYGGSLQQRMEEIASSTEYMLSGESERMVPRTLTSADGIEGKDIPDQKLWPLSTAEYKMIANTPAENYFELFHSRTPSGNGLIDILFGYNGIVIPNSLYSAHQQEDPNYDRLIPNEDLTGPVRPAFNWDISDILFTSDATGIKSTAMIGDALYQIPALPAGSTIKFTMKDNDQTLSVPKEELDARTALVDSTLTFSYSNAKTGKNQYVSCILLDQDGKIIRYGKIADSSTNASGDLIVPLKGIPAGSYTLGFFSEQANGDNYTDFAGEILEVKLTIQKPVASTVTYYGNGNTGGNLPEVKSYLTGDTVTVSGAGDLVKEGFTFQGWNTAPDGTGTSYAENDVFTMGNEAIALYAQWEKTPVLPIPEEPEQPEKPSEEPFEPEQDHEKTEHTANPKTGDPLGSAILASLLLASSGSLVVIARKKLKKGC
ncbi:Listeria-Bacteroides repeat domain (List_Bact_rpt) [uncultured Ruminococcus sp.]|nr:Listeria-Bacteroides repeat domain (List_Bact_rpt) [uncultured Clostridium sp.]SCI38038.1 Listeria-Bacteroides repeat domain (List_Bact_rpt) [uncultured Ruminococcus sp.]